MRVARYVARMEYTQIAYEVADGIATVTLDRPEQLNAFTNVMMREMMDVFDRTDADDDVRAVIVTGRGRGALFVRAVVEVPRKLSKDQKKLIEQLAQTMPADRIEPSPTDGQRDRPFFERVRNLFE